MTAARALALAAMLVPSCAAAQEQPSLLALFTPERLIERAVQFGLMGLRTQVPFTYGSISVSPLTGTLSLTDVQARPRLPYPVESACTVSFDRLTLRTAAIDETDLIRLKAQATGVSAPLSCLPSEALDSIGFLTVSTLNLGRLTFDLEYRISSGAATMHLYALAEELLAVSADAEFSYLWVDGSQDMDNPLPMAELASARVTVENRGLWTMLAPMVPPPFGDPAGAGPAIEQMMAGAFPIDPAGPAAAELQALSASVAASWAAFLSDPRALVIETGFDPAAPVMLDFPGMEASPDLVLTALQPRMALRPASAAGLVPAEVLARARDAADQLSDDERLAVGRAFATGIGAPRDLAAARVLLTPLADAGNGAAAALLARALTTRDAPAAYGYALVAAAAGEDGAAGLLDRIEADLPFATVLEVQGRLVEGVQHDSATLSELALIRSEAAARLTGRGQTRSYATAVLWALIGTAAGDAESADILEEIDERVRLAGPEAVALWETQEAASVELAREAWIGFDLPATFGGN